IDGYVKDASVCVDTDNNEATCEYTTTTNANGYYTIPDEHATGKVIITGGIDLDTNKTFTGVLKAPAGSKVATPLTTLLADGMTEEQVTTILGLPSGTDLKADFRASGNNTVAQAAATVQALLSQITAVFASDATLSKTDIVSKIVKNIQATITSPSDVTDPTKLVTIIKNVDTNLSSTTVDTSTLTATSPLVTSINSTVTTIKNDTNFDPVKATKTISDNTSTVVTNVGLTKYVALSGNQFTITNGNNTTSASFDQNGTFAPVTVNADNDISIGFAIDNTTGEINGTKSVTLAIEIDDNSSSKRNLKAYIENIQITSAGTTSTVTVPANAVIYLEGRDTVGSSVLLGSITNNVADVFTETTNGVTINLSNLMERIEAANNNTNFANITEKGSYTINAYISGLTLAYKDKVASSATALPYAGITIQNSTSTTKLIAGTKFTGTLIVE
ncbi:MAG: hypothetical protein IE914_10255, partial [Thiotrichales bacterium]|nr:hypothetical protein [Thiotrichales bacterium]